MFEIFTIISVLYWFILHTDGHLLNFDLHREHVILYIYVFSRCYCLQIRVFNRSLYATFKQRKNEN